jgi:TPR repeat protein
MVACLVSAIWYSSLPWLLVPRPVVGISARPVEGHALAVTESTHKFPSPSRGLSLVLLIPVVIAVAPLVRSQYAEWQRPRIHSEPIEALRSRSASGEIEAPSQLAERFTLGIGGVSRDDVQAAFWERKDADQGNTVAQYRLGAMYLVGQGVPRDYAQATLWASLSGSDPSSSEFWRCVDLVARIAAVASSAQMEEGRRLALEWTQAFEKRGGRLPDSAQTIARLRALADNGDADAQERLSLAYYWGLAVTQDLTEAARWHRSAGKQGRRRSSYRLALMYELGQGIPQDTQEAEGWYLKSGQEDSEASYLLGLTYQAGRGVPKDSVKAAELFRKAARNGSVRAGMQLGQMYEKGDGVPMDAMRSAAWYRRAADQQKVWPTAGIDGGASDFAEGARARDDEDYRGDPGGRYERALAWFTQGADRGHDEAQYSAALMYENGQGTPPDDVKALAYATLAAAQPLATHWREAGQLRDRIAARLTRLQLDEAQRLIQKVKEESIRHPGDRWD